MDTEEKMTEFIDGEMNTLQSFIRDNVMRADDPSEDVSDHAIEKSIKLIVATLNSFQQKEISRIKEEYCQKALEDQQKLMALFSGVLDKAVTALTFKGPLG
jgi:AICAR transformylase/IMP cyclohydrolase PurH